MLDSETGRRLVALSGDAPLDGELVNDAYKPRMHKLYASFMPAVQVRCLSARRWNHLAAWTESIDATQRRASGMPFVGK